MADLVIIGSGPGGYVAAIRAAQLGLDVTVVEKDPMLGGACLHRGCIPTKALLHTARLLEEVRGARNFGVIAPEPELDMSRTHAFKKKVVHKNAKGIEFLFRKNGIETVTGTGRIAGPDAVEVRSGEESRLLGAKHILIATGSSPARAPFAPTDGVRILDSDQILELERVPASLAVLGAGAVGVEFASIFATFGSQVTLIELLARVLPHEDAEISAALEKALKKRGISVKTGTAARSVELGKGAVSIALENGDEETLDVEALLVAVGRQPTTRALALDEIGVETDGASIVVNGVQQTSVPSIYAIGDVIATPQLAHVASAEGILAVEHMAGLEVAPIDYDRVPSCTYSDPEVASVGLTEEQARERGHEVAIGKFPFSASGKANIRGQLEGFVKIVRDPTYDELLGVHILGACATELIAEACLALQVETTNEELFRTLHAHPTLSEAMMEAAHVAAGRGIHVV